MKKWRRKTNEERKKGSEIDDWKKLAFEKEIQSHTVDIRKKKKKFIRRKGGLYRRRNKKKKSYLLFQSFAHINLLDILLSSFIVDVRRRRRFFFSKLGNSYYVELKTSSRFSFLIKTYKGDFFCPFRMRKNDFFLLCKFLCIYVCQCIRVFVHNIIITAQPCLLIIKKKWRCFFVDSDGRNEGVVKKFVWERKDERVPTRILPFLRHFLKKKPFYNVHISAIIAY